MLRERIEALGRFRLEPAPPAEEASILRAHDPAYVRAFLDGSLDAAAMRRIGFPWSPALVRRTLASAGGTLAATTHALAAGWGGTLAGGTHHAFHDFGAGYCIFNDIVIAIRTFQAECRIRSAAVVDLDVHQGDGTAAMLAHDSSVLTISLHGENNFPFRKQSSGIDVALADGAGDHEYVAALAGVLPALESARPDIVFYQAGVDPLAEDRLGRLRLTSAGLAERDRMVFSACRRLGIPVVVTLGGGYAEPIEKTVEAHARTYCLAVDLLGPGNTTA
jgi:acetoin utilization deacetylase AcuC-like enzyme